MLNDLQHHQSEFASALVNQGDQKQFVQKLVKTSKISPQLAIDIYRNNTHGARLKTLETIYPVCRKILGDEVFHSIASQYIIEDTEGLSDLNHYGEPFVLHLELLLFADRLPEEYCYLPDLARLEYKMHAAYYANNDPVFPFTLFERKVNEDKQVYFIQSASLGLIASEYPVYEIWRKNKDQKNVKEICPLEDMQYLIVYRNEYKSAIAVVEKSEYDLMKAINNNYSLQDIVENTECDIENVLPVLIANKWIVGIY